MSSDAQIALSGNAEYEKKQVENRTQISLVEDLKRYLSHSEYEVLPSNVGLKDAALATQIDRYNEMLIERKRLLRTSTESNPAIVNLDTSIRATKANVQATIEGTLQGLFITKAIWTAKPNAICVVSVTPGAGTPVCEYRPSAGNKGRIVLDVVAEA